MAIVSLPPAISEVQQYSGQQGKMPARTTPPAAAPPPGGPVPAEALTPTAILPVTTALDMAVSLALGHQDGLAAVFSEAGELAARPGTPAPVQAAIAGLEALVLAAEGDPSGDDVAAAVRLSGLFHEALGSTPADLKGALVTLRSALLAWVGVGAGVLAAADGSGTGRPRTPPVGRGTPLRGQASLDLAELADLDDVALGRRLVESADRALWRLFLHQAGRLQAEEQARADPARGAGSPQPTVVELPVAGPSGTSIVGLRIERDDRRDADGSPLGRVHRVELAFDLPPLGLVTARVGLMPGHRVAVGLWCDGTGATEALDAEREAMTLALEAAGLAVAGIDLHLGRPSGGDERKAAGPSHRLDVSL